MGRKLYVGNLPYTADNQFLTEKFGQFGTVDSANVVTDRDTGRSRGFGFVEMSSDSEAQKAIQGLNGTDCDGRPLTVNEARPQRKKSGGGGGFGRSGSRW